MSFRFLDEQFKAETEADELAVNAPPGPPEPAPVLSSTQVDALRSQVSQPPPVDSPGSQASASGHPGRKRSHARQPARVAALGSQASQAPQVDGVRLRISQSKRGDPNYVQVSGYMKLANQRAMKARLAAAGGEFSELLDGLVEAWLEGRV